MLHYKKTNTVITPTKNEKRDKILIIFILLRPFIFNKLNSSFLNIIK